MHIVHLSRTENMVRRMIIPNILCCDYRHCVRLCEERRSCMPADMRPKGRETSFDQQSDACSFVPTIQQKCPWIAWCIIWARHSRDCDASVALWCQCQCPLGTPFFPGAECGSSLDACNPTVVRYQGRMVPDATPLYKLAECAVLVTHHDSSHSPTLDSQEYVPHLE